MFTSQGLIAFSLGMTSLVFWTLTFLQCPFPSHLLTDKTVSCTDFDSWESLLLWCWPLLSAVALVSVFWNYKEGVHDRSKYTELSASVCFLKFDQNPRLVLTDCGCGVKRFWTLFTRLWTRLASF